ncbi:glutamine synthetase family protein [Alteraurantiacibacter buctensis]|uniref:Glutamine synthetase n=1 Tax=Alteraurantiacibacter buctensis TaxID=1503981 RepID=A0A844YZE0_9SPHN|nr:glutamine synthetase family protein [Alteraurantiacibacter buctensis]MXO71083.1 glutamine synthetase [Alteraurantiacibacter buctensis]
MPDSSNQIATVEEARAFFAANPDVDAVDIIFTNMCGVPRGKRLRQHEVIAVYESGRFLPGSVLVVDITGRDTEETGLVWEDGDADRYVRPVPGTLVRAPWLGEHAAQFLTSFYELDGTPNDLDPRHVLGRVVDELAAEGLTPVAAVELEFYLVDISQGRPRPAAGQVTGHRGDDIQVYGLREMQEFKPFFDDLYAACDAQGIPLESGISEYAAGQFEFTLRHKADVLRATDEAVMYKRLVKGVAMQHGFEATFMAKPFAESAGNGMHLHVSMNDAQGRNAFASEDPAGTELLRHAIGGMKALLADSMAIFAPNANSYRRFKANSYAPVAPTWGVNNRTVSLRVPAGPPASRHVEHRVCGADAHPTLALATVLAAMLHGIRHKIDPGPAVVGNGYESPEAAVKLPNNWAAAIDAFEASPHMNALLGERFVTNYACVKRVEMANFLGTVTELDYAWYLRSA